MMNGYNLKISPKLDREMEWYLFEAPLEVTPVYTLIRDHRGVCMKRWLSDKEVEERWDYLCINFKNGLEGCLKDLLLREE